MGLRIDGLRINGLARGECLGLAKTQGGEAQRRESAIRNPAMRNKEAHGAASPARAGARRHDEKCNVLMWKCADVKMKMRNPLIRNSISRQQRHGSS
jgi:hypothetical protein